MELMMALAITAMVAVAISGMLGAVTSGMQTTRDNRSTMVRASAAESRLTAYLAPSRCILASGTDALVLWLMDSRESDTVHATEIRWLLFNEQTGTVDVHYVLFPDEWSQAAKDLEDNEYSSDTNWDSVLSSYESNEWTAHYPLIDELDSISITTDQVSALASQHVTFLLGLSTTSGTVEVSAAGTIRLHQPPVN